VSRRNSNKKPKKAKEPKAPKAQKAPKKGKAPKTPKAPKASSSRGGGSKPPADVYTMFLFMALVAIIVGCVFLFLEIKAYGPSPTSGAPGANAGYERTVVVQADHAAHPSLADRMT